ncbi:MAG: hypothetical protein NVSMB54_37920 [Ktedonobacteraceae bacterium]
MRNSSLVKWFRADNVAGLKHTAEAVAFMQQFGAVLRDCVQTHGWVGERRVAGEAAG